MTQTKATDVDAGELPPHTITLTCGQSVVSLGVEGTMLKRWRWTFLAVGLWCALALTCVCILLGRLEPYVVR